jgi:hypothetical protein
MPVGLPSDEGRWIPVWERGPWDNRLSGAIALMQNSG